MAHASFGKSKSIGSAVRRAVLAVVLCLMATDAALSQGSVTIAASGRTFTDLRQAIAAAAPGDVLEVGSGTYRGALVVGKALTLTGKDSGSGLPTIDGAGARTTISLPVAGVTITNFRIVSSGAPKLPYGIFTSFSEEGCIVARAGNQQITDNQISGCHYGIYLLTADGTRVENNAMTGNTSGGIFIRNSKRIVVHGNRIEGNGYSGISVATLNFPRLPGKIAGDAVLTFDERPMSALISEDIIIDNNMVTGHGHGGIGIGYARHVSVTDNKVRQNGGAPLPKVTPPVQLSASSGNVRGFGIAINCDAYDNTVSGNEVVRNINYGILIDTSYRNQIRRNAVSESEIGIQLFGAYENVLEANKVRLNTGFGIRLERGSPRSPPSVANLLFGNDLDANRVNAFDTSGKDRGQPQRRGAIESKEGPPLPADLATPNRWDNGTIGNHYSDFDKKEQGFIDENGDGVGERAHAIPGGGAVDRLPLTAERVLQARTDGAPAPRQAAADQGCGVTQGSCSTRTAAVFPSCPPRL